MLKLTLLNKRINPAKRQIEIVRQNPDLLEGCVVDNTGTWDPSPRNGNGGGHVKIMNPIELKAVCADKASHPLTAPTFQKRKSSQGASASAVVAPLAAKQVEDDRYMGFSLNALGR